MTLDRRDFLRRLARAGSASAIAPALASLTACDSPPADVPRGVGSDARDSALKAQLEYGALVRSDACPEFEVAEKFRCQRLSVSSAPSTVRPSLIVPNAFDGMAAFPLPNGNIRLIRNHEMTDGAGSAKPLASPHYDAKANGGTTSLEVRISGNGDDLRVELIDEFVSLAGTRVNCAGGLTPWGSWLSCEENCDGRALGFDQPHGYIFEVPASATGPVNPMPLRAMGRFVHEAVAVDPDTGYVYETEDTWYNPANPRQPGSGLYRFIPNRRDVLADGGTLQVLHVPGRTNYLTARAMPVGTTVNAAWIDLDNPDPPGADTDPTALFRVALTKGAAIFARLEGAFWGEHDGNNGLFVVSTNGGNAFAGQVFHYKPTSRDEGELTLLFESPSRTVLDGPDNVCLAPGGGLVMCEDGSGDQFVRLLNRESQIIDLVRHPLMNGRPEPGEFAGSCFSPDDRVMFFNVQGGRVAGALVASATYAMWGPWQ